MLNRKIIILIIAICIYSTVCSISFINPQNINFLNTSDLFQHYLGWEFFRADIWRYPIGLNPNFGISPFSSIVFTDSIPLLAILFKPFSNILPTTFQYLGIWTFVCIFFQLYIGFKIVSLYENRFIPALLACILIGLAPPMLFRIGLHTALCSHFLILCALYLNLNNEINHRLSKWAILLVISLLVHFYLFAMTYILFIANLLDFSIKKSFNKPLLLIKIIIANFIFLGSMWLTGYFVGNIESIASSGYGSFQTNLLSLVDSDGWSYLLPKIGRGNLSYEGFAFLGIGNLLILIFALYKFRNAFFLSTHNHRYLLIAIGMLTCLAISNNIHIANYSHSISIPDFFTHPLNIIRSSGRFIWPLYYSVTIFALLIVLRYYPLKLSLTILTIAISLQLLDTHSGWGSKREILSTKNKINYPFSSFMNFWSNASIRYNQIIYVMPENIYDEHFNWIPIALLAKNYHLPTNSAAVSRVTSAKNRPVNNSDYELQIRSGDFNKSILYVLDEQMLLPALKHLNTENDLLAKIDDYFVLAPDYLLCETCPSIPLETQVIGPVSPPKANRYYTFTKGANYAKLPYLTFGWSSPEAWGTWSDGSKSSLSLPLPDGKPPKFLMLVLKAFVTKEQKEQNFDLWVNGNKYMQIQLLDPNNLTIEIPIVENWLNAGYIMLGFQFKNATSPKDLHLGDDQRKLGVALLGFKYHD